MIEQYVHWNEDIGEWQLKCVAYTGNNMRKQSPLPDKSKVHLLYILLARAVFSVSLLCFWCISVVFDCFWLSVPVQLIAWKDSSPNYLLCVEWDVKPYTLTLVLTGTFTVCFCLLLTVILAVNSLTGSIWSPENRSDPFAGRMA